MIHSLLLAQSSGRAIGCLLLAAHKLCFVSCEGCSRKACDPRIFHSMQRATGADSSLTVIALSFAIARKHLNAFLLNGFMVASDVDAGHRHLIARGFNFDEL